MSEVYTQEPGEGRGNPDTPQAAERYLRSGLAVIPVPAGEKNPNRTGWQNERHSIEEIPKLWTNGQGIGVLWGAPSGGLVDVDLDWPEAREAAKHILPETRAFGRPGAPESHRVYRAAGAIPATKRYKLGGDGPERSVVEVLSTGTQSLVPPSLHDSGERRAWHRDRSAAEVDAVVLMEGVADVATAALVARNWPGKGSRKDYVMAAAGCVGRRLGRDRAERVMEAAVTVSGDEEATSRLRDVLDTLDTLDAGRPATGGPALDALVPGVADQLRRWHGWGAASSPPGTPSPSRSFHLTDMGNAERLVARHGDDLLYCKPLGGWLVWDGTRWKRDESGEVERRAKEAVRSIYGEAEKASDDDRRRAIAAHAKASESRVRRDAMIVMAHSEPGIPTGPEALDRDLLLLNAKNGTIDLRTGVLRGHRRDDLITKIAPVEYDPDVSAPVFDAFLAKILPSPELRRFVQTVIGYAAIGENTEEILPIFHGSGANGKSTLVNVVMEALGDYAQQAAPDLLMAKQGSHPTELADLFGARFVAAVETDDGRRFNEGLIKQLTGRDKIKARRMREDFWQFDPTHTPFLATNHAPEVRGTDHAIWRRIKRVPFDVQIPPAEQDKKLSEKLREELPGVLAWMVRGALIYQKNGLREPPEVSTATQEYREEMDVLAAFIADECVVKDEASVGATPLYEAYQGWCGRNGEKELKQTRFGRQVRERGFRSERTPRVVYYGIGLRTDRPEPGGPGRGGDLNSSGLDSGRGGGPGEAEDPSNRLDVNGLAPNRLDGEYRIDKPNAEDSAKGFKQSNPESGISSLNTPHERVKAKKGLEPFNRLKAAPDTPREIDSDTSVEGLVGEAF